MSALPLNYLNCNEKYDYSVSIIALGASLGCSLRVGFAIRICEKRRCGSGHHKKKGKNGVKERERERERGGGGRKIARL